MTVLVLVVVSPRSHGVIHGFSWGGIIFCLCVGGGFVLLAFEWVRPVLAFPGWQW